MEEVRVIILNHGEDILTAYMRILEKHIEDEINALKKYLEDSNTTDLKTLSDTPDKPLSPEYYNKKKKNILKEAKSSLTHDDDMYMNPYLTEKGHMQAYYSGIMVKSYLKQNNLEFTRLAFSTSSKSAFDSLLEEVLKSYNDGELEIVIIPDFVENRKQYKKEHFKSHEVLDNDIDDVKKIMSTDPIEKVAERFKKGLEKLFLRNKETTKEGMPFLMIQRFIKGLEKFFLRNKETTKEEVPILMIQGSTLSKFFEVCIDEEIGQITDSTAYDVTFLFSEDGKFMSVKLNAEIQMDAKLSVLYNDELKKLPPLTTNNDFNHALAFVNKELHEWKSKVTQSLPSKNETNIDKLPKNGSRRNYEKKVSFVKGDLQDFVEGFTKIDFFGILDGLKLPKNESLTSTAEETTVTPSDDNLSSLATSPSSSNTKRPCGKPNPGNKQTKTLNRSITTLKN